MLNIYNGILKIKELFPNIPVVVGGNVEIEGVTELIVYKGCEYDILSAAKISNSLESYKVYDVSYNFDARIVVYDNIDDVPDTDFYNYWNNYKICGYIGEQLGDYFADCDTPSSSEVTHKGLITSFPASIVSNIEKYMKEPLIHIKTVNNASYNQESSEVRSLCGCYNIQFKL